MEKRAEVWFPDMSQYDGTNSLLYMLARQLRTMGWEVVIRYTRGGIVAKYLSKREEFVLLEGHKTESENRVDLVFVTSNVDYYQIRSLHVEAIVVFISVGVADAINLPPLAVDNKMVVWCVSQEVLMNSRKMRPEIYNYYDILANPVSVAWLGGCGQDGEDGNSVLILGKPSLTEGYLKIREMIKQVDRNCRVVALGFNGRLASFEKVRCKLARSKLVISVGRGVLEAIGVKRPVAVFDNQGVVALVDENNVEKLAVANFTGRNLGLSRTFTWLERLGLAVPLVRDGVLEKLHSWLRRGPYAFEVFLPGLLKWIERENFSVFERERKFSYQQKMQKIVNDQLNSIINDRLINYRTSLYQSRGWRVIERVHRFKLRVGSWVR